MAAVVTVGILLTLFVYFNICQNLNSTVVISPSELIRGSNLVNNSLKLALRYGFQNTAECKDFSKAFICVQKCLDLGFDIAYSDRHCFCTCFHKKQKPKSTPLALLTKTKWKLGAPTTKLPIWAVTREEKHNTTEDIHYVLITGNGSEIITANPTGGTETTSDNSNTTHVTGEVTTGHGDDNSTGVTHDGSAKTGGTGSSKDVTGTGTGHGNVTKVPSDGTGGTHASGVTSTGGTGHAPTGTKSNDVTSGGTGGPHTGAPHTGAPHTGSPHTGAPHTGA